MIGLIEGKLVSKDLDSLLVMTSGGVGYELTIPLSVYETLPRTGEDVMLHTSLVVKEDSDLMIITKDGKIIRLESNEIRQAGRSTQGVRLVRMEDGLYAVLNDRTQAPSGAPGDSH